MLPELQQQPGRLIRDYLDFAGGGDSVPLHHINHC
jgi:hypothetical protein